MSQKRLRDKLWNEFFSCSENGTRQSPLARPNDPLSRRHLSRNLFGESKNATLKPTLLSVSIFFPIFSSQIRYSRTSFFSLLLSPQLQSLPMLLLLQIHLSRIRNTRHHQVLAKFTLRSVNQPEVHIKHRKL